MNRYKLIYPGKNSWTEFQNISFLYRFIVVIELIHDYSQPPTTFFLVIIYPSKAKQMLHQISPSDSVREMPTVYRDSVL